MIQIFQHLIDDLLNGALKRFYNLQAALDVWFDSLLTGRNSSHCHNRCGMDRPGFLAVDLKGDVLTCQNVDITDKKHRIGSIYNLTDVRLNTVSHYTHKKECPACPVVHLCHGGCMLLSGKEWRRSCQHMYCYHMALMKVGLYMQTNAMLVDILDESATQTQIEDFRQRF